jgi:transcriptional regulator with GAF, ATPase, and Fis domain
MEEGDKTVEAIGLKNLGQAHCQQQRVAEALAALHQALALAEATQAKDQVFACHQLLAEIYEAQGDLAKALNHHKQYCAIKEEVVNQQADRKLHEQARQQLHIAASLREVAVAMSSSLDLAAVLEKILQQLRLVINYDRASIFLRDRDDLVLMAGAPLRKSELGNRISLLAPEPGARVFNERASVLINDVQRDPDWVVWPGAENYPTRSWMAAPLAVGDHGIGLVTADHFEISAFTEQDRLNLQAFAVHVAIA